MGSAQIEDFGKRLLPSLVVDIAKSNPDRIFYSVTKTNDPSQGFRNVTAEEFARAVDRCSWYIEETLGKGQGFPTLAFMGPQDVVYGVVILACIKTGHKAILNSARNPLGTHLSLFQATDCNALLLPTGFSLSVVKEILDSRPTMRVVDMKTMDYWLHDGPVEPYPYEKTFEEAKSDPFVVLHTSGSTGIAKPVVQTHETVSALDAFNGIPSLGLEGTWPALCSGLRVYLGFPLFHCSGMSILLPASIYNSFTVVLGPFPTSGAVAGAMHLHGNIQHSCIPPTTLVDLVKDPERVENLAKLKQVEYGGGVLPQIVGDLISSKTRLLNCLGTTECGVLPVQLCDPEDWAYLRLSPVLGHEYRLAFDDFHEQVVVRNPKYKPYQGIFGTFPDLNEWPMKDLYTKHHTKDNVWLYRGRTDDILILSTGDKLSPVEMENIIEANPHVSAALVTGFGRFQCALLIEALQPPKTEAEHSQLLDAIWPSIELANGKAPSSAHVKREKVVFTSAQKPMFRAGKGTVQRKPTVNLYATELDTLYQDK